MFLLLEIIIKYIETGLVVYYFLNYPNFGNELSIFLPNLGELSNCNLKST